MCGGAAAEDGRPGLEVGHLTMNWEGTGTGYLHRRTEVVGWGGWERAGEGAQVGDRMNIMKRLDLKNTGVSHREHLPGGAGDRFFPEPVVHFFLDLRDIWSLSRFRVIAGKTLIKVKWSCFFFIFIY